MVKDAEVRVRQALAEHLKATPTLPRDVAKALAADVELVALPVLEQSSVVPPDDLVEIIVSQLNLTKMKAIAHRPMVPSKVVGALVRHGDEAVVAEMVANPAAIFVDEALDIVVDRFGSSERVNRPLAERSDLPVRIAERLTALVADQLKTQLIKRHNLGPDTAMELVLATRERATLNMSRDYSETSVAALVGQLNHAGRLTPSLVLRAACMGHRIFLEHAMSQLANLPIANTLILMRDGNGFKNLWTRAKMPPAMFPAVLAAAEAAREIEAEGRDLDAESFSRRIIERVMTQYETFGVEFERDDLEYLFARVSKLQSLDQAP